MNTTRENFLRSMLISCFSFTEVSKEAAKILKQGGSLLTLTYESTKAIPNYNVMGVCKSALEASVKYLARDLDLLLDILHLPLKQIYILP